MGVGSLDENVLFTYSTKNLTKTEKVKFHYSMKGRNGAEGFLEKVNGKHIGSGVLIIPKEFEENAERFLAEWGIQYQKESMILKNGNE